MGTAARTVLRGGGAAGEGVGARGPPVARRWSTRARLVAEYARPASREREGPP